MLSPNSVESLLESPYTAIPVHYHCASTIHAKHYWESRRDLMATVVEFVLPWHLLKMGSMAHHWAAPHQHGSLVHQHGPYGSAGGRLWSCLLRHISSSGRGGIMHGLHPRNGNEDAIRLCSRPLWAWSVIWIRLNKLVD